MDPSSLRVTPGSGGSGGDGNGGRSVRTSSRRRRLTLSSTSGAELISEFDAAADGPGSRSAGPALDVDEMPYRRSRSRYRANPEDSPTESQLGRLLLVSPVRSPASTDDDVLIMDGVLVDSEPSTPSSARHSASLVDDNGPSNRRSVSIADLVLVSSDSQGSSGGGSSARRNGGQVIVRSALGAAPSNIHQQAQGAAPSNIHQQAQGAGGNNIHHPAQGRRQQQQQQQEFPFPNFQRGPEPPFQPIFHVGHFPVANPYLAARGPPPPPPAFFTIPRASYYPVPAVNFQWSPVYPQPPPPPPSRRPVVIRDPNAGEGGSSSSAPPAQPGAASKGTSAIKAPPAPKQPETQPPPPEQTFQYPPTPEEESAILKVLYGPSTSGRPRLPVFQDICPDDDDKATKPPSPPPPPAPSSS
ncbi:hypothetical protein HU200_018131 [Digitaria exilis]|uniref:Uncharacterized protein n=1 Tax=Digitaria exilis TaxID=1010633 RepID=A0A835F5E1_9POAL|nr:hypothetical protein HU200_018131 [Digitaria exilis]